MAEVRLIVPNPSGLHARPAARFVELAKSFSCEILVKDLTNDSKTVNAKSILGILTLGVECGHEILVSTIGEGADQASKAIAQLITDELIKIDHVKE